MERLFDSLGISQKNEHRIYDSEIIELSEEINLILILPPPQRLVQMSENDPENCLKLQGRNDLMPIGLNTFEVLHLGKSIFYCVSRTCFINSRIETRPSLVSIASKALNASSQDSFQVNP